MTILGNDSNPFSLISQKSAAPTNYVDNNGVLNITVPANLGGGGGGDRLYPSPSGLPANYGGMSLNQVLAAGTDLAGNPPTFSQLAGAGMSAGSTDTGAIQGGTGTGSLAGSGSGPSISWIDDWLQRGALIILGFIFVGVGLNMFGRGGSATTVIYDNPAKTAAKAGAKVQEAVAAA